MKNPPAQVPWARAFRELYVLLVISYISYILMGRGLPLPYHPPGPPVFRPGERESNYFSKGPPRGAPKDPQGPPRGSQNRLKVENTKSQSRFFGGGAPEPNLSCFQAKLVSKLDESWNTPVVLKPLENNYCNPCLGYYDDGNGKKMGNKLQFRTTLELSYQLNI